MKKKKILVDYTGKEFNSIKENLESHARLYYPDSYRDFSENSFGSFILDSVAYVGDMLSFYLDYQVNESFLDTAIEYDNVRRLAAAKGYRDSGRPAAFGIASFYIKIPANSDGLGPNQSMIPILKSGAEFATTDGTSFVLLEDVNFADPKNDIVASEFSVSTGKPSEYAIRAFGQVKSVALFRVQVAIGAFQKFKRIQVGTPAVQEIHSVFDSEGRQYYEVDHLSQDIIYLNTTNPNALSDGVPEIIKPKIVNRRFVVERDTDGTYLRFGNSSEMEEVSNDILDPSNIALKMSGKKYITDSAFDPTSLTKNSSLGLSPENTTLTVLYYQNSSDTINVAAGNLSLITTRPLEFPSDLSFSNSNSIRNSLEVSNDNPIVGNTSILSSEEIKHRTYSHMFSQNRAVTREDYEAMIYSLPSSLGSIKRASIINDPSSTNRRLSVYLISTDSENKFVQTNSTIKENLKTWINKNKMLNDNIDIYDTKIINLGIDYEIVVDTTMDKILVLNSVNRELNTFFSDKMYIGEPLYITNIMNIINKVDGVIDCQRVKPTVKYGSEYSSQSVRIDDILSKDGTYLKCPRNGVFEIKFFNSDVKGTAV